MKLRYFAWLRTRIGRGDEELDPPAGIGDVRGLVEWLKARGPGYRAALGDLSVVRVAVNLEFVNLDHRLVAGDEVAFFPPVTGG